MIARVASFEGVNVAEVEKTMDEADAIVRPVVEALPGYRGFLDLMHEDGRMLSIALFDSAESARAAEPTFDEEMPRLLGHLYEGWEGRRVSVDHYRVITNERA